MIGELSKYLILSEDSYREMNSFLFSLEEDIQREVNDSFPV
jgi:hypothetical protein